MAVKKANQQRLVVNQVIIKAPQRKTSDVGLWRTAMRSADSGRFKQLFDLYDDLYIDGILADAVDKRIGAVTNSEITFQNAKGEEVPEIVDIIDSLDFEELITQVMHARFWGRAGVEFDFTQGFRVYELPKKHIDIKRKLILINDSDETGISYENDDNILVVGKQRDFGLFLRTAPFAIWKRGGFGDYAQWLEIFGMPQRVGKYSSYDPESRKLLEDALGNAGAAPWVVIPKETDVETVNNTGNGSSGTSFDDFRRACNEEILITLLGQTLTTVQGDRGARSLGEVHKDVEESKNRSDLRFVQRVLNQYVVPLLEKRGYPVKGGWFVFPKAARELSVDEIVSLSDILEIPALFLHEKYAIPMPSPGDKIARRGLPEAPPVEPVDNSKKNNQGKDTQDPPEPESKPGGGAKKRIKKNDRSFLLRLWDFFAYAPALTGATANHLTQLKDGDFNDRLIGRIDGKQKFDPALFAFISQNLIEALGQRDIQLSDMSFEYGYQVDAFKTAQELNVFHFSAAKTIAEIMVLNRLYRESTSFEEFYKKASKETDVFNKTWQKTEYQTATNIASSWQTYHRLLKKVGVYPYWEYKTIGDDKVREEHVRLDGIILPANDPRWRKIWPPNGWKCRCYIVPRLKHEVTNEKIEESRRIVDEYLASEDWAKVEAQGFGINRALEEEVFTANQMYLNKFPTRAGKLLKGINYQTWKLGTVKQMKEKATADLAKFEGNIEDFKKFLENVDNKIFVKDYKGRLVLFDYEGWEKGHNKAIYAERPALLNGMRETIADPDEVWINNEKGVKYFNQYTFIRYYRDVAIVVNAQIKSGTVYEIKTWYDLHEKKQSIFDRRNGLLVYKKEAVQ